MRPKAGSPLSRPPSTLGPAAIAELASPHLQAAWHQPPVLSRHWDGPPHAAMCLTPSLAPHLSSDGTCSTRAARLPWPVTPSPAHPPSQRAPLSHSLFMLSVSPTGRKPLWQGLYLLYSLTSPEQLEWAWHWWASTSLSLKTIGLKTCFLKTKVKEGVK